MVEDITVQNVHIFWKSRHLKRFCGNFTYDSSHNRLQELQVNCMTGGYTCFLLIHLSASLLIPTKNILQFHEVENNKKASKALKTQSLLSHSLIKGHERLLHVFGHVC